MASAQAAWHDLWSGLRSRRGATLVAAGGLMLAQTVALLVALLAIAFSDPDPGVPEPERVVVLDFKGNPPGQPSPWFTASPVSFAAMLKARQVPLALISRTSEDNLKVRIGDHLQLIELLVADPDLVPLFGLKALHGDLLSSLKQHDGIAITPTFARKLWGELPLAQTLGRSIESRGKLYTVSAVIPEPDPRSSQPRHQAMVGYETQGNLKPADELNAIYLINGRVYARLLPGASVEQVGGWMREAFMAHPLYAQLPADWKAGREAAFFRGITLTQLPFEGDGNALRWQLLASLAAASALLLWMAAFNAMNLQAANLLQRQRETALRRSLGADATQLWRLWGLQALLPLLLAAATALLLAWWVAPTVANWLGLSPVHPVADPVPLRALLGLLLSVLLLLPLTLAAPAWWALRRAPAPALQGRTASEGPWGRRVRQGLLALQLGGACLLLAMSGVLALQHQHLLHADRGFETHNRLVLSAMVERDFVPNLDPFVAALRQHPAIQHWAFSTARPARDTQGQIELHVSPSQHKQVLRLTVVSPGFFDTYGIKLLAGKPMTGAGEARVAIDAKAARLLGFASPQAAIGATLRGGGSHLQEGQELRRVVAVVGDVKQESAREPALPQVFLLSDEPQWDLTVHGPDLPALRQALDEIWKAHGPPLLRITLSADEQRAEAYQQEGQLTGMLAAVALLAVAVAIVGAYALVADTLRRRRTELVLRRLHGADHMAITKEVLREFAPPLLLATLVALPLAAWLAQRYLAGFVDRIDTASGIGWPLAAAAVLMLLVVAAATLRHVRLALALRPIEALQ
jgi:putative ABC transport system permease protein